MLVMLQNHDGSKEEKDVSGAENYSAILRGKRMYTFYSSVPTSNGQGVKIPLFIECAYGTIDD